MVDQVVTADRTDIRLWKGILVVFEFLWLAILDWQVGNNIRFTFENAELV